MYLNSSSGRREPKFQTEESMLYGRGFTRYTNLELVKPWILSPLVRASVFPFLSLNGLAAATGTTKSGSGSPISLLSTSISFKMPSMLGLVFTSSRNRTSFFLSNFPPTWHFSYYLCSLFLSSFNSS